MATDAQESTDVSGASVFGRPQGARVTQVYMERTMAVYGIPESEMEAIAYFNEQTSFRSSMASLVLGAAIGIMTNAIFQQELTPMAAVSIYIGVPILSAIALGMFYDAYKARQRRTAILDRIKQNSFELPAPE